MVHSFTVTLSGSAQVLAAQTGAPQAGLLKQLIFHADSANGNVIYVAGTGYQGAGTTVSSSAYGFRIEAPVSTIPPAPTILEAIDTSLGDWQVIGTSTQKLHITCITA